MRLLLKNPLLRRYWFQTKIQQGLGVTAYSQADAEEILRIAGYFPTYIPLVQEIVEDIDVSQIVDNVQRNMGPPSVRGVWYPCLNLHPGYLIEGQMENGLFAASIRT
ncbi:MAG: hypothetical protein V4671_23450 [Armatimonadota bacterium]